MRPRPRRSRVASPPLRPPISRGQDLCWREVKTEPGGRLQLPRPDLLDEDRLRGGAVKRVHAEAGGSVDIGDHDRSIEITFASSTESLSTGTAAKIPRKEAKQSLEWCLPCPPGTPAEPAGG